MKWNVGSVCTRLYLTYTGLLLHILPGAHNREKYVSSLSEVPYKWYSCMVDLVNALARHTGILSDAPSPGLHVASRDC